MPSVPHHVSTASTFDRFDLDSSDDASAPSSISYGTGFPSPAYRSTTPSSSSDADWDSSAYMPFEPPSSANDGQTTTHGTDLFEESLGCANFWFDARTERIKANNALIAGLRAEIASRRDTVAAMLAGNEWQSDTVTAMLAGNEWRSAMVGEMIDENESLLGAMELQIKEMERALARWDAKQGDCKTS